MDTAPPTHTHLPLHQRLLLHVRHNEAEGVRHLVHSHADVLRRVLDVARVVVDDANNRTPSRAQRRARHRPRKGRLERRNSSRVQHHVRIGHPIRVVLLRHWKLPANTALTEPRHDQRAIQRPHQQTLAVHLRRLGKNHVLENVHLLLRQNVLLLADHLLAKKHVYMLPGPGAESPQPLQVIRKHLDSEGRPVTAHGHSDRTGRLLPARHFANVPWQAIKHAMVRHRNDEAATGAQQQEQRAAKLAEHCE
ncbi:hypothetical protein C3747_198g33 [Trypanosoma cruzi]|uniref:Uncharacterized protein n=1 Tax=Trypanosoma cruzi TaxID=5693 RepID=A0A2V2VXY9_TRYCR|nr:hypothetical protein C3747_198g33 [Trypanosoma cruzi]